jgi:hypothetical protein
MFNFGKATPDAPSSTAATVGQGGTILGDAAGLLGPIAQVFGRLGGANGPAGAVGGGIGAVGNFLLGASEMQQGQMAGGAGDMIASAANLATAMGATGPGAGLIGGGAQFIGHGIEALQHTDQIDAGYQNNQFWSEAGNATLGGANALAALDPTGVSSLYVAGTQMALDGIGTVAGWINPDWGFSAGSAIGGAEHLIFDSGQALAAGASQAWDATSDFAGSAVDSIGSAASSAWDTVSSW